jgi:hypothetical protein
MKQINKQSKHNKTMTKKFLILSLLLTFISINGFSQDSTGTQILTAHKWKSFKTLNNGKDVTGKAEPLIFEFFDNGKSKASSSVGSSDGVWSLEENGKKFIQEKVIKWEVIELTNKVFHILQKQGKMTIEIWFAPIE